MKLYHGTSVENLISILQGDKNYTRNWIESDPTMMYFYPATDHKSNDIDRARSSACICAAIHKSAHNRIAIIEIDIADDIVELDSSVELCFNDTVCISYEEFYKYLQSNTIHIRYYPYKPQFRSMYLYNAYHNCCTMCWDSIKDQVVDREIVEKECDRLYEETGEYENHFKEYLDD